MSLIAIDMDAVTLGKPLPFSLRDSGGQLLAAKGYVIQSRADLIKLQGRGVSLFVDENEAIFLNRALVSKIMTLVAGGSTLGEIARAEVTADDKGNKLLKKTITDVDWLDLQYQAHRILRDPRDPKFVANVQALFEALFDYAKSNPDAALLALFHISFSELRYYSSTHSMLVCVMVLIAARDVLGWDEDQQKSLGMAALTMNIGMTVLQDQLASQMASPSPEQRKLIEAHADHSTELLIEMGVTDEGWLQAVKEHHLPVSIATTEQPSVGQRMARLIHRADQFSARLSPRAGRTPLSPVAAMKASYFNEDNQVDEGGASLIKAVGIYFPGAFVRLKTQEVAVVVRRGINTSAPKVAVVLNRDGFPVAQPIVRDTAIKEYAVEAVIPQTSVKLQVQLKNLMQFAMGGKDKW